MIVKVFPWQNIGDFMSQVLRVWPLLTAMHRYDKATSTRNRGMGTMIDAPILAYLIETRQGRILYDVGCDYKKIADPILRKEFYESGESPFPPPEMPESYRLPNTLQKIGLKPTDIDVVLLSHLHFDHAGGLCDFCGCEIHAHYDEYYVAKKGGDGYFPADFEGDYRWKLQTDEYDIVPGLRTINTPGHTAGHTSLMIEMPVGKPIILAGDAADLQENITDEVAPGLCWNDREDLAISSIQKLKHISNSTGSIIWPNHDIQFWREFASQSAWHV